MKFELNSTMIAIEDSISQIDNCGIQKNELNSILQRLKMKLQYWNILEQMVIYIYIYIYIYIKLNSVSMSASVYFVNKNVFFN